MNVRTSIVIDRPIEEVWAYLDDHAHELEWHSPSLKRLERRDDRARGLVWLHVEGAAENRPRTPQLYRRTSVQFGAFRGELIHPLCDSGHDCGQRRKIHSDGRA